MIIKNVRIEERLIHGQVATVWLSHLSPDRIIIIDNETSTSDLQKKMLRIACPREIKLSIFSVARALEKLAEKPYEGEKVFILFKDPENLKEFIDGGFNLISVNVGNMAGKQGAKQIKKAVSVTENQYKIFMELAGKGLDFTAKMVPNDPDVNFLELLKSNF